MNNKMQEMFIEAETDLAGMLALLLGVRDTGNRPGKPVESAMPPAAESVEQTIDQILREK
jgi:hypothetical protein